MIFKSILITGGAGFIGSHVVEHFVRNTESRIVVLDKLTYAGNRANIEEFIDDSRVVFVEGDICDAALVESISRATTSTALRTSLPRATSIAR